MRLVAALAVLALAACGPPDPAEPSDPLRDRQWSLDLLDPDGSIGELSTGEGVVVAVVDSGVDASHPDLAGRVLEGRDFVDAGSPQDDGYGHGTHVAGVIAAQPANGTGIAGLAPDVRILPVRVLDDDGDGTFERTADGIRWAVARGAHVINLSLESGTDDPAVRGAVADAVDSGVVVVAAAGNRSCPDDGINDPVFPAAYDDVVGVSALSEGGTVYPVSSCGPWVDLAAPGVSIVSIAPRSSAEAPCAEREGLCMETGSSEAASFVSAAAALRIAQVGVQSYDARSIVADLTATATDVPPSGRDDRSGFGALDLHALLTRER